MFEKRSRVLSFLRSGFKAKSVLVVGDLMFDRYLWGEVSRISPEAPVPVVRIVRETESCGAAANVALNLANLGVQVWLAGWVGADDPGLRLKELLRNAGVHTDAVRILADRPTITKTRIIGGHQQMLRLDLESTAPIPESALVPFLDAVIDRLHRDPRLGAVVLSDYGKGALSETVCQGVIQAARSVGIPVLVDPKGVDYGKYRQATALTPNRRELGAAIPVQAGDLNRLLTGGEALRDKFSVDFLAVTLSEQGIALLEKGTPPRRIPAMAREVYDVSGAGDTVISTLAAGLAAGLPRLDALYLANLAAGVVVSKVGTTPVNRLELLAALAEEAEQSHSHKICDLDQALSRVAGWRSQGDRLVFTNGCFDLLHAGHVTYLEKARNQGDRLVVGLNTDRSVRALKGSSRPIIHEADRARVLAAMAMVDAVVLFDADTPLYLIRTLRPEILAKGADYAENEVVGGDEVKGWGGRVALIPLVEGRSTSQIMENIKTS